MALDEPTPEGLLRRHDLHRLIVARIPDALLTDPQRVDVHVLAATVHAESKLALQLEQLRTYPAPPQADIAARAGELIAEAGPAVEAFLSMSTGEKAVIRLVAALGDERVPLCAQDLRAVGEPFITDWWAVVRHHTTQEHM